jgi:hypothetical protein
MFNKLKYLIVSSVCFGFAITAHSQTKPLANPEIVCITDHPDGVQQWSVLRKSEKTSGIIFRAEELKLSVIEVDPELILIDLRKEAAINQRWTALQLLKKFIGLPSNKTVAWKDVKSDLQVITSDYAGGATGSMPDLTPVYLGAVVTWNFTNGETVRPGGTNPTIPGDVQNALKQTPVMRVDQSSLVISEKSQNRIPTGWYFLNNLNEHVDELDSKVMLRILVKLAEFDRIRAEECDKLESKLMSMLMWSKKLSISNSLATAKLFEDLSEREKQSYLRDSEDKYQRMGFASPEALTSFYRGATITDRKLRLQISFGVRQTSGDVWTTSIIF